MIVSKPEPSEKIASFVEGILVIEYTELQSSFVLPLFANGKPTLLFQTVKGKIGNSARHLTLFGQTVLPDQLTIDESFTLIAYFFKPFALGSLFGLAAHELTDKPVDLELVNYPVARTLQEQLLNTASVAQMLDILDEHVFSMIVRARPDTRLIGYATALIASDPSKDILCRVQDELCITERTFQRRFEQEVGLSPNQYRRVAQFNAAFEQLNMQQFNRYSDLALHNRYADQSHFIRAFKEFTHLTPKQYANFGQAG